MSGCFDIDYKHRGLRSQWKGDIFVKKMWWEEGVDEPFYYTTATAYYPSGNSTWTAEAMEWIGRDGDLTWVAYTDVSSCEVSIEGADSYSTACTGKAVTPAVTVKSGDTVLVNGTDYSVAYSNNVDPGTAAITVTGIGNNKGTIKKTFTIDKADQTVTVSAAASVVAGKTAQITAGGTGVLTYSSSKTSVATVSGSGVITAKKPGTVKITVKAAGDSYYNAASKTVTVKVTLAAGKISSLTNTSSGIKIKWSKVTGASGYYIYRKTSSGSYKKIKTIQSTSTLSYTDTAVKSKNGTAYTYKVVPYSGSTKGSFEAQKTVRLTGTTLSGVSSPSSKKMAVKWAQKTNVTGYQIQYSTSSTFASGNKTAKVSGATKVSKTISSLKKGKTYYVRIRTYKTVSGKIYYSAWSSAKKVKIS